jgi:hypothetical protein
MLLLPGATTSAPATEYIPENISKNIADVTIKPGRPAGTGTGGCMPELVVSRPFLVILENVLGFLGLFEMLLCTGIIRISVRMELHCQFTISFFEFGLVNISLNPEHFVVITLSHILSSVTVYFVCSRFEVRRCLIQA